MAVHPDFREFFALLNDRSVRYLVIGGVAYNYHAPPRATKDIDLWVEPSIPNIGRLVAAIAEFGFPAEGLTPEDLAETSKVLMLGRVPYRIDILTRPTGLDWEPAWANRLEARFGGVRIHVLGIDDLIAAKVAAGRAHDLADAEELRAIKARSS